MTKLHDEINGTINHIMMISGVGVFIVAGITMLILVFIYSFSIAAIPLLALIPIYIGMYLAGKLYTRRYEHKLRTQLGLSVTDPRYEEQMIAAIRYKK